MHNPDAVLQGMADRPVEVGSCSSTIASHIFCVRSIYTAYAVNRCLIFGEGCTGEADKSVAPFPFLSL